MLQPHVTGPDLGFGNIFVAVIYHKNPLLECGWAHHLLSNPSSFWNPTPGVCHLETVTSLAGTVLFCACVFQCSYNMGPFTFQKCLGICPASSYNHGHTSSIMRAHLYPFRYQTHHDRDPQDKPLAPAAGDGILSISFDLVSRYNDRS